MSPNDIPFAIEMTVLGVSFVLYCIAEFTRLPNRNE